jgi:hypothetical protein
MQARLFYQVVTRDRSNLLDRLLAWFDEQGVHYCVIGGQAVNTYD